MFYDAAPDYKLKGKYFALQLVLIFCKLQPGVEKVISNVFFKERICNEVTAPPSKHNDPINIFLCNKLSFFLLL